MGKGTNCTVAQPQQPASLPVGAMGDKKETETKPLLAASGDADAEQPAVPISAIVRGKFLQHRSYRNRAS